VLHLALDLVELAFALELAIARDDAGGLLDLALQVVEPAFQVLLVHARLLCGLAIRWPPAGCAPSLSLAGGDLLGGGEDGLVRRQHALRVDLQPPPGTAPPLELTGYARPCVVGDQRPRQVAVEPGHELREIARPQLDVEDWIEELGWADPRR